MSKEISATARTDTSFVLQLYQVRLNLLLGAVMESWIERGIDAPPHLLHVSRAGVERVEHLPLALQAMSDVLIDQGHCIIASWPMSRIDPPRIASAEGVQGPDVVRHVAIRQKDLRRSFAKDGVTGKEIAFGSQIADVLARVAGRG